MAFIEASKTGSVADTDAEHITYDNTESGLESDNVQGAIDEIKEDVDELNDNLAGFKFYPTGTNLVALISDDSFYKDANDKYVLWGTATAEQLVEDNPGVYKSLASTEDCRGKVGADSAVPFSSLEDINANYSSRDMYVYATHNEHPLIPIKGYSKIGLYRLSNNGNIKYRFEKKDGTYTSQVAIALSTTPQEVDIPQNAVLIEFEGVDGNWNVFYGLKV